MKRERRPRARRPAAEADKLAVALGYDPSRQNAPKVVAKGQDAIAEQIVKIARENDVAIRQDADLVRLLSAVELDTEIPVEAFVAVAEILAYVYRNQNRMPDEPGGGGS